MKHLSLILLSLLLFATTANAHRVGDVNGDSYVNRTDITALIDMIFNHTHIYETAADVNNDGVVNAADISALVNILNNKETESSEIDYTGWMSRLDDNMFLSRLSIPGSHNACTSGQSGSAHCQTYTLSEQLSKGVRMFDLRPRWDGSTMYIYHGMTKTSVKFNDAMSDLCSFLDNHPNEFLFVIMRHEDDNATTAQKNAWPEQMYNCLNAKRDYIIDYSPTLTVKEMRGKILVMSRNEYSNGPIGAYLQGGGDNSVYDRTIVGTSDAKMSITTQDMYDVAGSGELDNKVDSIKSLLNRSIGEKKYCLYFNHTSGYSKKIGIISTSAGVQECAKTCNKAMIDYMQGKCGPMGFIMMDFACDNTYYGQDLVDLIIRNNYALMKKEHNSKGDIVKGEKTFVLPMGADLAWEARYVRKDASSASTSAVDALSAPATDWMNTNFDDSSWATMKMPLASKSFGAPYRTQWDGEYNCYWMRRTFLLDEVNASSTYHLMIYHDDDYKVYINGHLIDSADGWTDPGSPVIKEIDKSYLNVGKNVIAIMNQQNWGGAYSDCGIYETK